MKIKSSEKKDILEIIKKWTNLSQKEIEKIKYVDDLLKIANEHGITITIEK